MSSPSRQQADPALYPVGSRRGFTLFELVVVIVIISILAGLFMNRVMFYQELAEKTAMEQMAGTVQNALLMQYGKILTRGQTDDIPALAIDNPMHWLQRKPRNYAGEFYGATPESVAPGNWMFDLKSRELIYVLQHTAHFKPGKDGLPWIRFHVVYRHEKPQPVSLRDSPAELVGILFEPVEPYVWE
jgi:general secretion pathway protein G